MPYINSGDVSYEPLAFAAGVRHRFRWTTTSAGVAVFAVPEMIGRMVYKASSYHRTSGSGTYTITLIDELDADWLGSQLATLTINTTTIKTLADVVTSGAAKWALPLMLGPSELYLRITHTSASTYNGVLDLYEPSAVANV